MDGLRAVRPRLRQSEFEEPSRASAPPRARSGTGGYHDAASDRVEVVIPDAYVPETGEVAIFNPDAGLTVDPG